MMPLDKDWIESRRSSLGLNQTQAGELALLGKGHTAQVRWVQVINSDNPKLSALEGIALALNCRLDDFVRIRSAAARRDPPGRTGSRPRRPRK